MFATSYTTGPAFQICVCNIMRLLVSHFLIDVFISFYFSVHLDILLSICLFQPIRVYLSIYLSIYLSWPVQNYLSNYLSSYFQIYLASDRSIFPVFYLVIVACSDGLFCWILWRINFWLFNTKSYIYIMLVVWVLWYINLWRLFNAQSIFIQIINSISNTSVYNKYNFNHTQLNVKTVLFQASRCSLRTVSTSKKNLFDP